MLQIDYYRPSPSRRQCLYLGMTQKTLLGWVCMAVALAVTRASRRVLVLGGTGFVGQQFIQSAVRSGRDIEVVAVSRRGEAEGVLKNSRVKYISADVGDASALRDLHQRLGPFDSCLHCIGLLFDQDSGLSGLNRFASGSGSTPDASSTYDKVTRQTAMNAIDAFLEFGGSGKPFVFISAAEAGWTFRTPVDFLERYLTAKRAVESRLLGSALRPVIFRPSIIWTKERPQGLLSAVPFYIANKVGIPFIDRPVRVDALAVAILRSMFDDETVSGLQNYRSIEALSAAK